MGREAESRSSRVVRGAILVPGVRSSVEDRHAIADAGIEGGIILGAAQERERTRVAMEKIRKLITPLRVRIREEYKKIDSQNSPTQNALHEDVADALSDVEAELYGEGLRGMVNASKWNDEDEGFYPLAYVTGEVESDALRDTLSSEASGIDLEILVPQIISRRAYPTPVENVFIIDTRYNKRSLGRRSEITVVTPSYIESVRVKPNTP